MFSAVVLSPALAAPDKIQVAAELSTKNVRTEESNLADIIADAVIKVESADVAFLAASSFAEIVIPKGPASAADIVKSLAFRTDTVVIMKLTGAQIKQALAHGLELYPQRNRAFLQVAGLTAGIDGGPSADKDKRIISITVSGSAVDDKKKYTVAMPSPLANGALAFDKVWSRSDIDHDTGRTLEECLTGFLSGKKSIGSKSEERLVFKK